MVTRSRRAPTLTRARLQRPGRCDNGSPEKGSLSRSHSFSLSLSPRCRRRRNGGQVSARYPGPAKAPPDSDWPPAGPCTAPAARGPLLLAATGDDLNDIHLRALSLRSGTGTYDTLAIHAARPLRIPRATRRPAGRRPGIRARPSHCPSSWGSAGARRTAGRPHGGGGAIRVGTSPGR